jgi:lantibiotic modifying enzyme
VSSWESASPAGSRPEAAHGLLRIACRAQQLHERLGSAFSDSPESGTLPPGWREKLLAPWIKAFARGDAAALERRLAWSGWNADSAARAFLPRETGELPAWTAELAAYCRHSGGGHLQAAERASAGRFPFEELWQPWLSVAREGLPGDAVAALSEQFMPAARAELELLLLRSIADLSGLAALELYNRQGPSPGAGAGGRERYRGWVRQVLADPLAELYEPFPQLARRTCELVRQWRALAAELALRWRADRRWVAQSMGAPAEERVATLRGGLSDSHENGREVLALQLESGFRLLYKPRCVQVEQGFGSFLAWCRARGLGELPPAPAIAAGRGYGWVQWIEQEPARSLSAARRYHRAAGALLAVAHVLRARDLHAENLVATSSGPVVVDAEVLLQPRWQGLDSDPMAAARHGDCLETGLLLERGEVDAGEEREWGGLRPVAMRSAAVSSAIEWSQLGCDDISYRVIPASERPGFLQANALWLEGSTVEPGAMIADLLRGFRQAYRFLLRQRQAILAADGPLAAFGGLEVRLLLRPSQDYARLLTLLLLPRNQRSGLAGSLLYEAMISGLAGSESRPALWPLHRMEMEALLRGDVPRFAARADAENLTAADGEAAVKVFAQSGLAAVRELVAGLDEGDLRRQERAIRLALGQPRRIDLSATAASSPAELFRASAARLGRLIAGEPGLWLPAAEDPCDLDSGSLGTALFLASLPDFEDDPSMRQAGSRLLERCERFWSSWARARKKRSALAWGGLLGAGSAIYGLAWLGSLREEEGPGQLAEELAAVVLGLPIEEDVQLDLLGGSAGLLLAALALDELRPGGKAAELARRCGEHLLARQIRFGEGAAWPNRSGLALAGWAHGASGIARALSALAASEAANGRDGGSYARAAAAAIDYEDSFFDEVQANWPVLGRGGDGSVQRGWMNAWCHGAPGIVLSRSHVAGGRPGSGTGLAAALARVAEPQLSAVDHLCCGNLGRAAVLAHVAARQGLPDWGRRARELTLEVLARVQARGFFALQDGRLAGRAVAPGFLKGLAGIGYHLLKSGGLAFLPEVMALELPGERAARVVVTEGGDDGEAWPVRGGDPSAT